MKANRLVWAMLALAALALPAVSAQAGIVTFSGTETNSNFPGVQGGRCGPVLYTVSIGPAMASGTSNFGAFTPTQSHCIAASPPVPPESYTEGLFSWGFGGGNTLFGTDSGMLTASGTPGVTDNSGQYVVTGGTGFFAGATGSFTGNGTVTVVPGSLPHATLEFRGDLNLPGVPEPATWAMMLVGLGGLGASMRLHRTSAVAAV